MLKSLGTMAATEDCKYILISTQINTVYSYSIYDTLPYIVDSSRRSFHHGNLPLERQPFRLGKRAIFISRDYRRHYSPVHPVIHCRTGLEPGHLELLLLRKWLVVLSRAR